MSRCRASRRRLVQAILAIEDQRFYDHRGVDIVRVAGAALNNVLEGRLAQGGSTLTQQLARQSFLTPDKTVRRKLTEIFVAARLERQFTQGRDPRDVSQQGVLRRRALRRRGRIARLLRQARRRGLAWREAALLAGLVKAPSSYAPTVSVERAKARRNVVLQAMRDEKVIDRAAYDAAVSEPVVLDDGLRRGEAFGQYFKEEVRRFLVQRFGWERVYQGGLKVYTTVDLDMQKAAEAEVARRARRDREAAGRAQDHAARSRCRPRWSRWTRTPATCARWSAAAISRRARSIAPRRPSASPARRSSRSSMRPRSSAASRRPRSSTKLDEPIMTLAGRVGAGRRASRQSVDDDADGAADVEQSSRGADAGRSRHSDHRAVRASGWASVPCRACRRWRWDRAR